MRCWTAKPWVWTLTYLTVTQVFVLRPALPSSSSISAPLSVCPSVSSCYACPHVQVQELVCSQVIDRCKLYQRINSSAVTAVVLLRMCYCGLPVAVGCWVTQQESSGSIQRRLQWHSWSSLEGGRVSSGRSLWGREGLDTKVCCWSLHLKYMAASFLLLSHASSSSANWTWKGQALYL